MTPTRQTPKGVKDIRSFFPKKSDESSCRDGTKDASPPGAASATVTDFQAKVKKENDEGQHLHQFRVKFSQNDPKTYAIHCDEPRSVLDVLKSNDIYRTKKFPDGHVVIQMGTEDKALVIATHFPCSCIEEDECLIISHKPEKVEDSKQQHYKPVCPRNNYSVFYIDTQGGVNTKTKPLFRSKAVTQYKYLCVYGHKGTTVEEAVNRDGRFVEDLRDFTLSDNDDPKLFTDCKQRVDNLDQGRFKICLPVSRTGPDERVQESLGSSSGVQRRRGTRTISDVAQQRGISVKAALEKTRDADTEEVYERLREQCPELRRILEDRAKGPFNLRREDFGKIEQSFSEVHRVRKLLNLGRSVCKLVVENVCTGTGFVLFDNFILTNAHLFKDCVEGEKLQERVSVIALFNYDEPEPHTQCYYFSCSKAFTDLDRALDYAVLELNPEVKKLNRKRPKKTITVPPGLMEKFGPMPRDGEACIIGHPKGQVKKMDPTRIIAMERREEAVNEQLQPHQDTVFVIQSIRKVLSDRGIDDIMMSGREAERLLTYNTFMYHGSSGSPVFDAHCHVVGLHSAGFTYGFPRNETSVIEYARPLLLIFEKFVMKLKDKGCDELLKRVEEKAKANQYLKRVLEPDEPMDVDE